MDDPVVYQPTVVLRYHGSEGNPDLAYWAYSWWDTTVDFVGGNPPTRDKRFNALGGVLAALLADAARTLTAGRAEEHEAEPA